MGKRLRRTQALLALVLLYQLSQPSSASAAIFDWLTNKDVASIVIQPLDGSTTSYSENTWNNNIDRDASESLTKIKIEEPLTNLSTESIEEEILTDPILVLKGVASYYSWEGCLGCNSKRIMANGKALDDKALTMAIGADKKHLVGHKARVTNLSSGKSVVVTITDTGGFYQAKYGHRVADLTIATKEAIGMTGGLTQVQVDVL